MKKGFIKFLFFILFMIILIYNPISARIMTFIVAYIYDLDSDIFYRQIATESSFRCLAYSPKKAIGLGQVKKETANYIMPSVGSYLLWFPPINLIISAKYTNYLLKKYNNNWSLALAAYNWGETNVDKRIKNMKIKTNKNYKKLFSDVSESYSFIEKIYEKK